MARANPPTGQRRTVVRDDVDLGHPFEGFRLEADNEDLDDPILIDGQWREIDTGQDLDRARQLLELAPKEWS